METERIDYAAENADKNVEKNAKLKNIAVTTAKFAGAVGVGVAGTMATNAMKTDDEDTDNTAENTEVQINPNPEVREEIQEEITARPVTDFNPDDIVIDVEDIDMDDDKTEALQTITEESYSENAIDTELQPIIENTDNPTDNQEIQTVEVDVDELPFFDVDDLGLPENYHDPADMDALTVIEDDEQIFDDEFEVDVFPPDDEEELYTDDDDISEDPDILDDLLA